MNKNLRISDGKQYFQMLTRNSDIFVLEMVNNQEYVLREHGNSDANSREFTLKMTSQHSKQFFHEALALVCDVSLLLLSKSESSQIILPLGIFNEPVGSWVLVIDSVEESSIAEISIFRDYIRSWLHLGELQFGNLMISLQVDLIR